MKIILQQKNSFIDFSVDSSAARRHHSEEVADSAIIDSIEDPGAIREGDLIVAVGLAAMNRQEKWTITPSK